MIQTMQKQTKHKKQKCNNYIDKNKQRPKHKKKNTQKTYKNI